MATSSITTTSSKPLSIAICTIGSRGDVQPYLILALKLQSLGCKVTLCTENRLRSLVEEFKVPFGCIEGDSVGILYEKDAQAALRSGSFMKLITLTTNWEKKFDKQKILKSYQEVIPVDTDIIVTAALCMTQTLCIAQARKIKWITMILGPTYPTAEYPVWALAGLTMGCSCLNKWTYNVVFRSLWSNEEKFINPWRTSSLNLSPIPKAGKGSFDIMVNNRVPVLVGASVLTCGPHGRLPGDYPSNVHVDGFLFQPDVDESTIDPVIVEFLNRKDALPVVYLGFGSMPAPDPFQLLELARDTCKLARCRAMVITGWSQVETTQEKYQKFILENKDTLCIVKAVPHSYLFPRMKAIVHHCGIGTTASALKSGVPQVCAPFMLDQPHNAKMLKSLGVASAIVPYNDKISAAKLAPAIRTILNEGENGPLHTKAKDLGKRIEEESRDVLDKFAKYVMEDAKLLG